MNPPGGVPRTFDRIYVPAPATGWTRAISGADDMENYEVIHEGGLPIKAWVRGVQLENAARQQLVNVARLPFIHKHVAAMPDVHWGKQVVCVKG